MDPKEENKEDKLSEKEFHILEMANTRRMLAQSQAEAATQKYENIVLQISVKYGLTDKDSIGEEGKILRGNK